MNVNRTRLAAFFAIILLLAIALVPTLLRGGVSAQQPTPGQALQHAWRNASASGSYHFDTKVLQVQHPGPSLANVGQSSTRDTLHIEGETDLNAQTLRMSLWNEANAQGPDDALHVLVEDGYAFGRCATCEWEPIDDVYGPLLPGADMLGYLAGARGVQALGNETVLGMDYTRYGFTVDGPAFGAYLGEQMETYLRERGELPPGLSLNMAQQYQRAEGSGELWVGPQGLPRRLLVHLSVPAGDAGDWIEAEINSDFARYDMAWAVAPTFTQDPLAWSASQLNALAQQADGLGGLGLRALTALAAVLAMVLIVRYSRLRRVYAALVVCIILSMVVTPLMQSHQVYAFGQQQANRQQQQADDHAERQAYANAQQQLAAADWNPHRDPLASQASAPENAGSAAASSSLTFRGTSLPGLGSSSLLGTDNPDADSDEDGDGLTFAQECFLGTDANSIDTDNDGITDDVEIEGFVDGLGTRWYLNPFSPDSNNDGLLDAQECPECVQLTDDTLSPRGACRDTDGDQVPDVYDDDNDGDGVADRVDLAPFTALGSTSTPFDRDRPFNLVVDQLEPDRQVFVDIQLRPKNPEHLAYHYNVLDWPTGDTKGQIQRVLDTTFADQPDSHAPSDANGDMRLIPMLEITIPYQDSHHGNLPVLAGASPVTPTTPIEQWLDGAKLDPYGISVSYKNDSGDLLMLVPLNLVPDETGGGKAAFSAHVPYFPSSDSWGNAHQMRVLWLLQMVSDVCDQTGFTPSAAAQDDDATYALELETYCSQSSHRTEMVTVVHAYDEEWVLTGLAVREDHGMHLAVALEDPTTDPRLDQDDQLWTLALGLGESYLAGRTDDQDQLDVNVADIKARWDNQSNGSLTDGDEVLWGIPKNALRVSTYQLDSVDDLMQVPMTITKQVLDQHFRPGGVIKHATPLLLFARQEIYRTASLGMDSSVIQTTCSTGQTVADSLQVVMDSTSVPELVMNFLQWQTYRNRGTDWEVYDLEDIYDPLWLQLKDALAQQDIGPDDLDVEDQADLAMAFYLSLYHGASALVQRGAVIYETPAAAPDSSLGPKVANPWITIYKKVALKVLAPVLKWAKYMESLQDIYTPSKGKLDSIKQFYQRYKYGIKTTGTSTSRARVGAAVGILIGGAVIAIGLTVAATALNIKPITYVANMMALALSIYTLVATVQAIRKAVSGISGLVNQMNAVGKTVVSSSMKAGIIGLVVAVVLQWGMFVANILMAGVSAKSLAFTALLAETIANTVASIIMFVIACIPIVGQIIMAVVALIDAMIQAVCAFLPDEDKENEVVGGVCKGITGWCTELIKWTIYSQTVMVDLEAEDRLSIWGIDQSFINPQLGVSDGNSLAYAANITTTIRLVDVPADWKAQAFWWQYDYDTLTSAAYKYDFATVEPEEDDDKLHVVQNLARHDEMNWLQIDDETAQVERNIAISSVPLPAAGINQPLSLYIAEGFALPAQECWAAPPPPPLLPYPLIPVCYIRTFEDTTYIDLSESFQFDVFPATLDGFYVLSQIDLVDKHQGFRLGWDTQFERNRDADGDGLLNKADGGTDPNDSLWDTDGDGLGDEFELSLGYNAESADQDNDGLVDSQELRYGTDPYRRDTDGDGLADGEEFWHQREDGVWTGGWEIIYGFEANGTPKRTWVNSDPLFVDNDWDTLSDYDERLYAYSPHARNSSTVLTLDSQIAEIQGDGSRELTDGFVRPGQSLHYTATVGNELMAVTARGLLDSESYPAGINTDALAPINYNLKPQHSQTLTGQVGVASNATSGKRFLTQVAGALLVNERAEANFAEVLLHLDEATSSAGFEDSSGIPYHNATCVGGDCPATQQPGVYGYAADFDNDILDLGAFDIQGQVSLATWVKLDAKTGERTIISHGPDARGRQVFLRLIDGKYMVGSTGATGLHEASVSVPTGDVGQWVHLAGVYDGTTWRLYRNGVQLATHASTAGALPVNAHWSIGGRPNGGANLDGALDEVAIYATALSSSEIERLYSRPVVHMQMDESAGASTFVDSSGLGNFAVAWPTVARQPMPGQNGILRKAVSFDGGDCLIMSDNTSLQIGEPRFTLAAWLKPQNWNVPLYDNYVQGVLGLASDSADAYPTLQVAGSRLRAGFSAKVGGTGAFCWYQYTTSHDWLSRNAWNHVVVTFDGVRFRFYVDGQLCDNEPGIPQDAQGHAFTYDANTRLKKSTSFWIGRTSNTGSVHFDRMVMDVEHDAGSNAEPYLTWDGVDTTWSADMAEGDTSYINIDKTFTESGTAALMESDSSSKDDTCGTHTYLSDMPAPSDHTVNVTLSGGLEGTLYTKYYNSSIPFKGLIDEIMVYNRALQVYGAINEVEDLYNAATISMRLRLDEPPGANVFRDWTGQHNGAVPIGSPQQPTTGVAGRVNQAVWFDGDDTINVNSLNLPARYTLAGWVRSEPSSWPATGSTIMEAGQREPWLGVNENGELQAIVNSTVIAGGAVPAQAWTHVAYVWDGSRARLYVNGEIVRNADVPSARGEQLTIGHGTIGTPWHGELDDLIVYKRALSSEAVRELCHSAPQMMLHCDDAAPFQDDSGNGYHGTCDSACPATGDLGRIDGCLTFDGVDQYVELPTANTLGLQDRDFTVSAWVKAQDLATSGQHLVLGNNAGTPGGLSLGIRDAKPYLGGYGLDLAGETELQPNFWYHLAWVLNDGVGTILMNGSVVTETSFSYLFDQGTQPLYLGGSPSGQALHGSIDEVTLYHRALSARELNEIYNYQASWVQDRAIHEITIDAEAPTSSLLSDTPFIPLSDPVMAITAHDATSRVTDVAWRINSGTWEAVPPCTDAVEGAVWCPTFSPSGEGAYMIETRATDLVGNFQNPPASHTIYVDDTPPVPLSGIANDTLLPAPNHPSQIWHRVVHLHGTVSDPALADSSLGSGVAALSVSVWRDDGMLIGTPWQEATLTHQGGNVWAWEIDYAFQLNRATGNYTVEIVTEDAVGNTITVNNLLSFRIDATTPIVTLTSPSAEIASQGAISQTATIISGEIDDAHDSQGHAVHSSGIAEVEIAFDQTTDGNIFSADTPVYQVAFEQEWFLNYMGVTNNILHANDTLNHSTRGQVGDYALWLDGIDDWVYTGKSPDLRDRSFTVAFWAKPESPGVILTQGDGLVVGTAPGGGFTFGFDGTCGVQMSMLLTQGETLQDLGDGWVQYAFVYDHAAGQKRVFWRGYGTTLWSMVQADAAAPLTVGGIMAIGQPPTGCDRYAGALDDLRVYDHALSAQELSAVDRGWWPAETVTPDGSGKAGTWSTTVPSGLEGFYAIRMRGSDTFDNVSKHNKAQGTWQGMIDSATPRLHLERQYLGEGDDAKTRYLGYVQDLNLVDDSFACPCELSTVSYEHYDAAWYTEVYTQAAPRLYRLGFDCEAPGHQYDGVVIRGQDAFGHQAEDIRGGLRSAAIYTATDQVTDLDVTSDTAYLALGSQGIETVNISQPTEPVHLGISQAPLYGHNPTDYNADMGSGATSPITFATNGPAALNTVALITVTYTVETGITGSDYLRVWLVSPRGTRLQLESWQSSSHHTFQETRTLHEFDDEPAYGIWRLHVVDPNIGYADIRDWEITVTTKPVLQNDLAVTGNHVYGADEAGALRIWDVSNPAEPWTTGYAADGQGNGSSGADYARHVDITDDGRYTAFSSEASNLVPGDTNGHMDVFVHDGQTGTLERISVASDGTEGDLDSRFPRISQDGRWVVFESLANTLVAGDSGWYDVFLHDRQTHTTRRLSVTSTGNAANSSSNSPVISADGRFVAYRSFASNLVGGDNNAEGDVLVHDRDLDGNGIFDESGTGKTVTVIVSRHTDGTQGDFGSDEPAISANGRYVVFTSKSDSLVDLYKPDCDWQTPCEGTFIRDRDTDSDGIYDEAGAVSTEMVSLTSGGWGALGDGSWPDISDDGRYVSFSSDANDLVPNDTNDNSDVFVRDRNSNTTRRASVTHNGQQATGGNSFGAAISGDGQWVAFQSSATNIVADDTNGTTDVFLWNSDTEHYAIFALEPTTELISHNAAGQPANGYAVRPAISADGRYLAFASSANDLPGAAGAMRQVYRYDRQGGTEIASRASVSATAVCVDGDWAFLGGESGLEAYLVSDPTLPKRKARLDLPTTVRDMAISGDRLYVVGYADTDDDGLRVYQISHPSATSMDLTLIAWQTGANLRYSEVLVKDDICYVGGKDTATGESLLAYDVSAPTGELSPLGAGYTSLANGRGLDAVGQALLTGLGSDVAMVDKSDPAALAPFGATSTQGTVQDLRAQNGFVHVANGDLEVLEPVRLPGEDPVLATIILAPQHESLYTGYAATEINGYAYAEGGWLQDLRVTIAGDSYDYSRDYYPGVSITNTHWSVASWTPSTDGVYAITALTHDTLGGLLSDTITVTVDTSAPTVAAATTVFTTTHYQAELGQVTFSGTANDATGVGYLATDLTLDGEALTSIAQGATSPDDTTGQWLGYWLVDKDNLPDGTGAAHDLAVQVTDRAGNTDNITQAITIDVVPPITVPLSMAADSAPVAQGDIVPQIAADLTLTWDASQDAAGLGTTPYWVRWYDAEGGLVRSEIHGALDRSSTYGAIDGQRISVELMTTDINGNQVVQTFGPINVEAPTTPDYVALDTMPVYQGWLNSGCSLIGIDDRVAAKAQTQATLKETQRFYASWDAAHLRLTWTGANWDTDGDLFIYLDTVSPGEGGAVAYNPYPGDTNGLYLPGASPDAVGATSIGKQSKSLVALGESRVSSSASLLADDPMLADYAIWVQDGATAWLLAWESNPSGDAWQPVRTLSASEFSYDAGLNGGQTDLLLLKANVNLDSGGPLDMVAFATEDDALSLWASMPSSNPLSSELAAQTSINVGRPGTFALTQRYHWDNLDLGLCPNGSQPALTSGVGLKADQRLYADSNLALSLTSTPVGSVYAYIRDSLFWLWSDLFGSSRPLELSQGFDYMDGDHTPLGDGDTISYLISVTNHGEDAAGGVRVDLTAHYALQLLDGGQTTHMQLDLGSVAAGQTVSATVTGVINLAEAMQGDYLPCMTQHPDDPDFCQRYLRWAALDATFYDQAHGDEPLDWFWSDNPVDPQAPAFCGILAPDYAIATGENLIEGYAYDDSEVAHIDLEIQAPSGGIETITCWDCATAAGSWSYNWNVAATSGEYQVRVRAVDEYDQQGPWSNWTTYQVDATLPSITLSDALEEYVQDQTLQSGPATLAGSFSDDLDAKRVEVCYDGDCQPAVVELVLVEPVTVQAVGPTAISSCPSYVEIALNVAEDFEIGAIALGLNATHPYRDDLQVELVSPQGKTVRVVEGEQNILGVYQHYDVTLSDAADAGLYAFRGDDDPSEPYYDRSCRPSQPLNAFLGDQAQGTWTLRICDRDASQHNGDWGRAQLVLTPRDAGAKTGSWQYAIPPDQAIGEGDHSWSISAYDSAGNRSGEAVLRYTVDREAPALTWQLCCQIPAGDACAVITGTVTDASGLSAMYLLVEGPDGHSYASQPTWVSGSLSGQSRTDSYNLAVEGDWGYSLQPDGLGTHTIWIMALDAAGNTQSIGPLEVEVVAGAPQPTPEDSVTPEPLPVEAWVTSELEDTFCPGWTLRYTLHVRNTSTADVTALNITNTLPANTCCAELDATNAVAGTISDDGGEISWYLARLAPGQTLSLRLSVHSFTSIIEENEVYNTFGIRADQLAETLVVANSLEADLALCGLAPTGTPTPTTPAVGQVQLPLVLKGGASTQTASGTPLASETATSMPPEPVPTLTPPPAGTPRPNTERRPRP